MNVQFKKQRPKTPNLTLVSYVRQKEIYKIDLGSYITHCRKCGSLIEKIKCPNSNCNHQFSLTNVQKGFRPVLVVEDKTIDTEIENSVILIVPITGNYTRSLPNTVLLPANQQNQPTGLETPSLALVNQLKAVDSAKFFKEKKIGVIGDNEFAQIQECIMRIFHIKNAVKINGNEFDEQQIIDLVNKTHDLKKIGEDLEQTKLSLVCKRTALKNCQQSKDTKDQKIRQLESAVQQTKNNYKELKKRYSDCELELKQLKEN